MKSHNLILHFFIIILFIILVSTTYYALSPNNPTSPDYNIPLAKIILNGQFLDMHNINSIYLFFPGASNLILSVFIFLNIPLNLFGVFTWVILIITSIKLAYTFGLSRILALFYTVSVTTTIAVVRTINDQSIDKWLCIWFMLAVILLEKPNTKLRYYFTLGLATGMLIGTKYSGPFFLIALLIVYLVPFLKKLNLFKIILISIPFSFTGLFWYIRNYILMQNPYYPANFLFFKGYPNYSQQDWMLWRIPFYYPQGLMPLLNSYISEYSIWVFAPLIIALYIIYVVKKKLSINAQLKRLFILISLTCMICLILPITPPSKIELFHIISDMRYIYIPVFLEILAVFIIAKNLKQINALVIFVLVGVIGVFSFIPYEPKIYILSVILYTLIIYIFKRSPINLYISRIIDKLNL